MKTLTRMTVCVAAAATAIAAARAADPAITIYNQNFAVVRETIPFELQAGINEAHYAGVTAQVEPDSVILRDPSGKTVLQVLEQNYRNDPVSQPLLLSFFEGKTLEFVTHEVNKPDRLVTGKVIRSGFVAGPEGASNALQPIIEVDGKLQFSLPGEPRFPTLGDDTILKPALSWKLNSAAPVKFDAELAYVTGGLTWEASYNVVAPENAEAIDLVGWITMKNSSGAAFTNAKIKLMAGNVNKLSPDEAVPAAAAPAPMGGMAGAAPVVKEKTFDEFHLYTLQHPATLRDQETKQVEFVRATGIAATRLYIYDGADLGDWRAGQSLEGDPETGVESKKTIAVYREFKNSEANHLGLPLPKGRIRFYTQDEDRQLEFVGENEIDHTPKDELVRLYIGNSFDLVGERKRLDFKTSESEHWANESFEIKLRNHKKQPVEIRVVEHLYRWTNWTIKTKSQEFKKTDAQTIEFTVALKPDEEKTVNYRVRYSW